MSCKPEQFVDRNEVRRMTKKEKERELKERLKANYETYIQQLEERSASDLISMASEIAAANMVYEELKVEGAFTEYVDYLLEFKNPLEVIRAGWREERGYGNYDKLHDLLWTMADSGFGVCRFSGVDSGTIPAVKSEQGVTMC